MIEIYDNLENTYKEKHKNLLISNEKVTMELIGNRNQKNYEIKKNYQPVKRKKFSGDPADHQLLLFRRNLTQHLHFQNQD